MDNRPFIDAQQELRQRFLMLLDSLSSLHTLVDRDGSTQNELEILKRALASLIDNQDFEYCSIFLLEGDLLKCQIGVGWDQGLDGLNSDRSFHPHTFARGEGLMGQCIESGEMIFSSNCSLNEWFAPRDDSVIPGSLICAPIYIDGEVIGVLNASHSDVDYFHPWHANILQLFCNVLGQMICHHRLTEEMEGTIQSRTLELKLALRQARELKQRYEQLSIIDDLTGLYNRRYFFPEATAELSRAVRNQEFYSVLMMDIDYFKAINDTYSHIFGDQVLSDIAAALKRLTRDGDILCRYGGEEFAVVLPNTSAAGAIVMAERFRKGVKELGWETQGHIVDISLSIGVSTLTRSHAAVSNSALLETLLKEADLALYQAKRKGRDQVCSH